METGTSTSAPVVQAALAALGIGACDLATVVVTHIHLDHAGDAGGGDGLDHAVEAVRQRTMSRYLSLRPEADPEMAEKFERLSGAAGNVSGIWHWLDKVEQPEG